MLYNKDGTPLFKLAQKIKKDSKVLFTDLEKLRIRHEVLDQRRSVSPTSVVREERSDAQQEGIETSASEPELSLNFRIGDLEPCLESLELFLSSDAIHQELNIELDHSIPIASLFKYEFAKMKPPPPEASETDKTLDGESIPGTSNVGKKGGRKTKPKRDRKAEAERARLNKLAKEETADVPISVENTETSQAQELQHMLDTSAGFRAPVMSTTSTPSVVDDKSRQTTEPELSTTDATSKGKKRASAAPANHPTVPRVVSTVDNRDSFNFFNAGWILPADQKRGGRVPISQQSQLPTLPPPRKKQKTGI